MTLTAAGQAAAGAGAAEPAGAIQGRSPWRLAWERVRRDPAAVASAATIVLIVVAAVAAPAIAHAVGHGPDDQYTDTGLTVAGLPVGPSHRFLLGTDNLGRDLLVRIAYGARISLLVGVVAVAIGSVVGVISGLAAGYVGGWLDAVIMRLWDVLLAFPAILIGIAIAAMLGPGVTNAAIALAVVSIPQFSRITRASVLAEKQREYVQAARAIGVRSAAIAWRHILPNTVSPLLVQLSLAMGYAVLLEAGLSFLGLGAQPPEPSWGGMLNASRTYLRDAPHYAIFPGLALSLLLLGLTFLSDALRDALDPKLTHLR
jgi:peptide/nickel transport system permease protein